VTHAHYLSVSLSSRETYLLLVRTIARHLRTYIHTYIHTYIQTNFWWPPKPPFQNSGYNPRTYGHTDIHFFGGPPNPLSRTRVTTLGQTRTNRQTNKLGNHRNSWPPTPPFQNSGYNPRTTPPAWRFLSQCKLLEDGSIRNECVRTPTVALLQTSREIETLCEEKQRDYTYLPCAFFSRGGKLKG